MRVASIKHAVEMKVVADTVAVLQMKAPPQRKARPDYKALWGLAAALRGAADGVHDRREADGPALGSPLNWLHLSTG